MLITITASTKKEWKALENSLTSEQWDMVFEHIKSQIVDYTQEDLEIDVEMHQQTAYARGYHKNEPMIKAMTVIERLAQESPEYSDYNMCVKVYKTGMSGVSKPVVSDKLIEKRDIAQKLLMEEINASFF